MNKIISKETAEHYIWSENCDGWHLIKSADLSVIYEKMPPGTFEVRHYHQKSRQFFFVLEGAATLEIDGKIETLRKGEGAEVPPNVPHQMFNNSETEIEFLVISQPPAHGDRHLIEYLTQ